MNKVTATIVYKISQWFTCPLHPFFLYKTMLYYYTTKRKHVVMCVIPNLYCHSDHFLIPKRNHDDQQDENETLDKFTLHWWSQRVVGRCFNHWGYTSVATQKQTNKHIHGMSSCDNQVLNMYMHIDFGIILKQDKHILYTFWSRYLHDTYSALSRWSPIRANGMVRDAKPRFVHKAKKPRWIWFHEM